MDQQIENLIKALQEEQEKSGNDHCCPPDPLDGIPSNPVIGDQSNLSNVLQEIYHTSSFLQRPDSEAEGLIGYNITRHSVLSVIQNPYMCAMCGVVFAFSGNLTKHIRTTHTALEDPTVQVKKVEPTSTDEKIWTPKKRGRPRKTDSEISSRNKENEDQVGIEVKQTGEGSEETGSRPRRERKIPKRYQDDGGEESVMDEDKTTAQEDGDDWDKSKGVEGHDADPSGDEVEKPVKRKKKKKSLPVEIENADVADEVIGLTSEIYKPFPCEFCAEIFRSFKQRSDHRLQEHENEILKCKECEKLFPLNKFWLYQRHCQTHERAKKAKARRRPEGELVCNICGTSVTTAACLSIHIQHLHPEAVHIEKPFRCAECGKVFRTKYLLKSHIGLVHTDEKPFSCSVCGKGFKTKRYLEMHLRVHTGEKPFGCRFCDKCFRTNAGRRKHERIHTKERPYKCQYCDKDYYTKISMLEHTTSAHTQDRPLMCEICGKTFVHRASLRQHKFLHTGQKPFVCQFCNRAFSQKVNLQDHVRSLHTHEKPYKCKLCEMAFSRSTGRNEHMKKNTNLNPK
ncbi:putative zinc finger protein [Apostichopus japonicus]|uniref:Putative zinc finger protein n=1 Tax=Stichopus japonicus TaxID=307972 RepID=A0A2G8KH06_STIJA|nr:putative zinc finger protein [Apostichopus japonicus]